MGTLFSNLLSESIFDFRKWSNLKYANMHICVFSVLPLLEVKNWFWKQIWKEYTNISILNLFLKSFGQYLKKKVKNGFPIVFSKSDLAGIGSIFLRIFFLKEPNTPKICLSLGGSMPDAQIKQCPLAPSPILVYCYLRDYITCIMV